MNIKTSKQGEELIVNLAGRLDTVHAVEFQKVVDDLPEADLSHVTVDCAALEYISSSGLRAFISFLKKAQKCGGTVELLNLNSNVKEVFDMTGFSALFGI